MALVKRVRIYKQTAAGEIEVSDAVSLGEGKGNPFGFSTAKLMHGEREIGQHYCGNIELSDPLYRFTVTTEEE